jgi:FAD/FMN-containing dehydrogenase
MVGATVVLADASVVHVSETENSDLFWALRGAGGGFGIVSEFEFDTFEAPEVVTVYQVRTTWNQTQHVKGLKALQDWVETTMPRELSMRLEINANALNWEGNYYGTAAQLKKVLDPIMKKTGGAKLASAKETDWYGQITSWLYGAELNATTPYDVVSVALSRVCADTQD